MLTSVEFLAENRYTCVEISAPSEIEPDRSFKATLTIEGNVYAGHGENGHLALCAAIQRYRDTNPDDPGVITMTLNADRDHA
jgi:hypothetical protein